MPDLRPKPVRQLVTELSEAGFDPEVTGQPGGAWEVAVVGDRIRVTAGFVFRNGKTRRVPGTCTVDGEPHALVDLEALHALWDEYEGGGAPEPEPPSLMEITDPGTDPAPHAVGFAAERLAAGIGDKAEVRTGRSGAHWVVGLDLREGTGLRMVFTRYRRTWEPDRQQQLQVVVDGVDASAEAGDNVEAALSLVVTGTARPPADTPPGGSAVRQRDPGRPTTGVATRKMVVIRE